MITAGVDVGTRFLKIAVVEETTLLGYAIAEMRGVFNKNFKNIFSLALKKGGLNKKSVKKIIATGYGAALVKKAAYTMNDDVCIARACSISDSSIRSVIDSGGLFIKVITLDDTGFMEQSHVNEKCASGSGRFLEMIAETLHVSFDDISETAAFSRDPYRASTSCAVFSESEIISQINMGRHRSDILAGVMDSLVSKALTLFQTAGARGPVALTGGLSLIPYYREKLERALGEEFVELPVEPQIVPAYGAALLAQGTPVNRPGRGGR